MTTPRNAIDIRSVSKHFGPVQALNGISIKVAEGEIYGFLGLNGAGKTTLIRIMLGMIHSDQGHVELFGDRVTKSYPHWNNVGYLVETPYAYPDLSVADNLRVFHDLRKLGSPPLIDNVIDRLKLNPYKHRKAGTLSLGNRQRLGLAKALMHRPHLLILDEPINGLDPEGIVEVRSLLKELAASGTTIFLSSHIISELARVATRIGMIHHGSLIKEITQDELQEQLERKVVIDTADNSAALSKLSGKGYECRINNEKEIELFDATFIANPERVALMLVEVGLPPRRLIVKTEDLENFFLRTIRSGRSA